VAGGLNRVDRVVRVVLNWRQKTITNYYIFFSISFSISEVPRDKRRRARGRKRHA
jgi:hypothetical protein